MITVNQNFQQIYHPDKAFLVYKSIADQDITYIESYDIAPSGRPINAHPLTTAESISLARSLAESSELNTNFLQPKGVMPENLLYCSIGMEGYAIWYTAPQKVNLCFSPSLGIPNGVAALPALVWKADKHKLEIFALRRTKVNVKPDLHTDLFHAPFFNIYESGKVCMGTVNLNIHEGLFLEGFISAWEHYFFNSNFSHAMPGHAPVKSNIVQLWRKLVSPTNEHVHTGTNLPNNDASAFPENQMKPTGRLLKDLMI